ncbi:MAG: hypothetical protein KGI73_03525 [Patescibacteria group bacterium]|nr:hypothetical protein [Patescibacteria group bacterium]
MFDELSESERKKIRILPRWKRFSPEQIKALQFLSHKYGEKVADLVAGVSIVKPSSKDTANRTEYIKGWHAHVAQIIKEKHRRLFIIKLADFVDNATGLETIQSDKKRLALAQKYTAVYRLFVDGIGRMSSLISKDNRRVIIRTLEEAEPVAEEIIKREDGRNRAQ